MSHPPSTIRRSALILTCLSLAVLAGCAQTKPLLNQPLTWRPSNSLKTGVMQHLGTQATVRFLPFENAVAKPSLIGENVEKATPRLVTTTDPVGPFVAQHLQSLLAQAGYKAGGANASRVISGVVHKFFVHEKNLYRATLEVSLTVRDRSGKVLWSGTVQGKNTTFGRSYRMKNYMQVLSNSVVSAADQLLQNAAFKKALTED